MWLAYTDGVKSEQLDSRTRNGDWFASDANSVGSSGDTGLNIPRLLRQVHLELCAVVVNASTGVLLRAIAVKSYTQ